MSKSLGNAVEPWDVLERFGADALRWYFFTSKQPWDGYRFSYEAVGESVRLFLRRLWNVYHLYALVCGAGDVHLTGPGEPTELDRWTESRLAACGAEGEAALAASAATAAGRALA